MGRLAKGVGYAWALPVTALGLLLAAVAVVTGGSIRLRAGVVEVQGGLLGRLLRGAPWRYGGAAMTLGHVILARDEACLERSRAHELHHVRQFARWGVFLLPVYWSVTIWLRSRGFDPYLDNPFEPKVDDG